MIRSWIAKTFRGVRKNARIRADWRGHCWAVVRLKQESRVMVQSKSRKLLFLGLGALSMVMTTVDCSRRPPNPVEDTGTFRFSLKLSSLAEVDSVSYVVSGNGITPINGLIDITGTSTATAVVSGLPAATGYSLSASATSTDGKTKCVGNTTFAIKDGSQTQANLVLECTGPNQSGMGTVGINGTFDNCPVPTSIVAIPSSAPLGGSISLIGTYSDLDGDKVTFSWSQNPIVGSFGALTSDRTTFICNSVGVATLSFEVSDGNCAKAGTMTVACLAAGTGGSGMGGSSAAGGSDGSGGSGVGGDNGVDAAVGTGGSGAGGALGVGGITATGGSGAGGTGLGGSAGGSGAGGSGAGGAMVCTDPTHCDSLACEQCSFGQKPGEPDLCGTSPDGCHSCDETVAGCDGFTDPNDRTLCQNLYACLVAPTHPGAASFADGSCLGTFGDPLPCWCGTNLITCATANTPPSQANGPCRQQVFAAAKTTDAPTINAHFVDPTLPLGAAVNLAICRGSFCPTECSIPQ
jgi:hypothetical protein